MLPNIGMGELLVISAIALLLFGAKRLPEVARGLGKSVNAFKQGLKEISSGAEETPAPKPLPQEEKKA
ncbi:MAG: twin-arginine translocase TatA/TatE family subunit [Elusimicrobia bacterium]|nr:twin-arginine translocase TatA/TatE family subunit [Elusimicrobiota bacterium]